MITSNLMNDNNLLITFEQDVLKGLTSHPKYLDSKYFYDARGDKLFQEIMASPDYYLTNAELEIFQKRCADMLEIVKDFRQSFDLIELGAGDALKSTELLKCLSNAGIDYTYYPVDISDYVVKLVEKELPEKIPGIKIKGIQGEYFKGLETANAHSANPKMVLFLGGNIGNMPPIQADEFLLTLSKNIRKGDVVLIGFDLKKNPWTIFNAYNDSKGITREFNLNLLRRINRELNADFDIEQFEHYESYDPETGACKSYLISLKDQKVAIKETEVLFFENEHIFTETSQKYTPVEIDSMAQRTGFKPIKQLFDSKKWFADVIWRKI